MDTTSADGCDILVAAPGGLASEVAARKNCVEVNGKWVPAESAPPSGSTSTTRDWAAGGTTWPDGGTSWSEAARYAGQTLTVCGPLAGSGYSTDDAFLNLGLDYPDSGRFQIVIWDVGRLESIPLGATLCTTGRITLYEGVGQIELTDPGAVLIYD
ncbi:hypothetical protein WDU99_13850 [Microbacterium sp. Mu-80]|uniref:LppP/LprE family lipoprotein n=1 Tax=Microbacterium bandirmense TaxID=3122050 RepID=A0ABU8LDJ6_9MICO